MNNRAVLVKQRFSDVIAYPVSYSSVNQCIKSTNVFGVNYVGLSVHDFTALTNIANLVHVWAGYGFGGCW